MLKVRQMQMCGNDSYGVLDSFQVNFAKTSLVNARLPF